MDTQGLILKFILVFKNLKLAKLESNLKIITIFPVLYVFHFFWDSVVKEKNLYNIIYNIIFGHKVK